MNLSGCVMLCMCGAGFGRELLSSAMAWLPISRLMIISNLNPRCRHRSVFHVMFVQLIARRVCTYVHAICICIRLSNMHIYVYM